MDRRKSIKALMVGSFASGVLLHACKPIDVKDEKKALKPGLTLDRQPEEKALYDKLMGETFFTPHEMATITILADIIIPKDAISGSASDAKVPDFIEFIVKDMPHHQTPMRGGLKWLDMQCLRKYNAAFIDSTNTQQMEMVDAIAWPQKAAPNMQQGVAFFNHLRDLVASGFYTSEIGVKDLDYRGNVPNQWNGVPNDILQQYNLAYTEKELKECVKFT
jgi:hypothetical protein